VLTDFSDGNDVIGMDGLKFDQLTVEQGDGDYVNHTVVKYGTEYLLVVENTPMTDLTSPDFTPL
jgi:hypothetical protein